MISEFFILVVLVAIGIMYLVFSGETPENAQLPLQIGVTIVTGGIFVFFERFITRIFRRKDDIETLDEIRLLREEVTTLTVEIERLRECVLEDTSVR